LSFDPAGSLFVVFARSSRQSESYARVTAGEPSAMRLTQRNGRVEALVTQPGRWMLQARSGRSQPVAVANLPSPVALQGPWSVHFANNLAVPVSLILNSLSSWTEQPDQQIKYYSGTAAYATGFMLDGALTSGSYRLFLELGEVHDLVEVRLNGQELGALWKPPFTTEITRAARAGRNQLELAVTNTWRNRLIGDYGKPQSERTTFVAPMLRKGNPWLPGGPGATLLPAGLLGPVRVRCAAVVTV
jgi:hypothetical protein